MKKWLSAGLLIAGLGLFGHGAYMQAKAWLAQVLIEQAWQEALKSPGTQVKPWYYADSYVTAKLDWPSHNKTLSVLAGASGRNLAFAPSQFLPAGELGGKEFGNEKGALIAGHNDTHFAFLQHAKVGEAFTLQLQSGVIQNYKVTGIEVIHQSQNSFIQTPGLYLLTCYPFDSLASGTDLRLLVSAQMSSPDSLSGISTTSS
ncbi:class GN sortase [Pseudoalteromonas sp. SR41-1]|uniref:class GN sortase n=1 Tax=Pseudoalteromonas sp. SR41-1 TaxID=2760952 RepID=UPI001602F709|nr:class GN sortase [Pseudoalteromonas sp. SR41-1]MBB1279293.1 class GN sortase [Pseudoalteromonas sp. SR41-1]